MSLLVWLPLNGNIDNQGLNDAYISGSVSYTSGSTFGSYASSGSSTITLRNHTLGRVWSFCFWGYIKSSSATGEWTKIVQFSDGGSNMRVECCPSTYSNGKFTYTIHDNSENKIFSSYIGSSAGYYDQWTHVCFTSDGTTISRYINGTLDGTTPYNGTGVLTGTIYINNNHIINKSDFRFYDNCLSQKEVKAISKGLVAHYRLDKMGNLDMLPNLINAGETMMPNFAASAGNTVLSITRSNGVTRLTCTTAGNTGGRYGRPTSNLVTGKVYTWSCEIRSGGVYNWTSNSARIGFEGGGMLYNITTNSEWKRISMTFTQTTSTAFVVYPSGCIPVNGYVEIKNLKLEEGSLMTDWCPNTEDSTYDSKYYTSNTTIFDSSGYNNHGKADSTGTISISSDSKKYFKCIKFGTGAKNNGVTFKQLLTPSAYLPGVCLSVWFKSDGCNASGGTIAMVGGVSVLMDSPTSLKMIYQYGSSGLRGANYNVTSTEWHHAVVSAYNGSVAFFLDGVKKQSYTQNIYNGHTQGKIAGNAYGGMISDLRVYCTGFSDDEAIALYKTQATIDNDGNMFTDEFVEVESGVEYLPDYMDTSKILGHGWGGQSMVTNDYSLRLSAKHGWQSHAWSNTDWVGKKVYVEFDYIIRDSAYLSSLGVFVWNSGSNGYNNTNKKAQLSVSTSWQHLHLEIASAMQYIGINIRITDGTGNIGSIDIKNMRIYSPGQNVKINGNHSVSARQITESMVKKSSFGMDEVLMDTIIEN